MPKYAGKDRGEVTAAQSPEEGVEAHMRLLFDDDGNEKDYLSGKLYAMKDGELVYSDIDKMPQKQ